jgi:hypothetical protein
MKVDFDGFQLSVELTVGELTDAALAFIESKGVKLKPGSLHSEGFAFEREHLLDQLVGSPTGFRLTFGPPGPSVKPEAKKAPHYISDGVLAHPVDHATRL